MTSSRPHRSRLSFGTPGPTATPSSRVSSCASWPAESRHSFGPACSVCTLIRSMSSLAAAAGSTAERRSRSSCPPRETNSRIASSESTGVSCQPVPAHGRHDEQRDRPLDPVDLVELLAGHLQPCRGGDPPAPQLARVELVGVREHPPREVIGLPGRQTEAGGERPALRPDITEHGRVRQVDRERGVCSAQLLVELARGRGDAGPVKAGVRVRARLPVDERLDRRERQMARVERDAVAAQHRLRVLIGGPPCVAVVRDRRARCWPA